MEALRLVPDSVRNAYLQAGHAPAPPATMALLRGLLAMSRPPSPARPPLHWRRSLLATAQLLLLLPPPDAEVHLWLGTTAAPTCCDTCGFAHLADQLCTSELAPRVPAAHKALLTPAACSCSNCICFSQQMTGQLTANLAAAAAGELSGMRALAGGGLISLLPVFLAAMQSLVGSYQCASVCMSSCNLHEPLRSGQLLIVQGLVLVSATLMWGAASLMLSSFGAGCSGPSCGGRRAHSPQRSWVG